MAKKHDRVTNPQSNQVLFMEFWLFVASQLGSSRLKVNPQAASIHHMLDKGSDHQQYLKNVITQSYKRSRCHHLNSSININYVLDVLGETAFELQGKHCDDLFDIELLEEIAWLIGERYAQHIETLTPKQAEPTELARVISMPGAKIKRANSKL